MARRPRLRRRIRTLVEEREPKVTRAFRDCVDDIKANISLARVAEAIERGDVEAAIAAMGVDRAAFAPLEEAVRQAYVAGGAVSIDSLAAMTRRRARAAGSQPRRR